MTDPTDPRTEKHQPVGRKPGSKFAEMCRHDGEIWPCTVEAQRAELVGLRAERDGLLEQQATVKADALTEAADAWDLEDLRYDDFGPWLRARAGGALVAATNPSPAEPAAEAGPGVIPSTP